MNTELWIPSSGNSRNFDTKNDRFGTVFARYNNWQTEMTRYDSKGV